MNRTSAVLAIVLAAAVAACQRAPQTAAAQPSPAPASTTLAPAQGVEPGPEAAAAPETVPPAPRHVVQPRTSTRTAQASRGTTSSRSTSHSGRVERVDRVPAAEPIDLPPDNGRPVTPRDDSARRAEAEPETSREPVRERITLPAGTELQLVLEEGLSSATSHEGDAVTARVARATAPDGTIVLPGGTVLKGKVFRAESAGRVSGRSHLGVDFDRIVVRGTQHRLETTAIEAEGPESHGRDAAIIGGSTVGAAIIGGILGGGHGAKTGAVVGAVGGTGAVLATKGKEVEIAAGSHWTVTVRNTVHVD
jgi:hypothetical protein